MSPEERDLITDLFERMRSYGAPDKDREADALIQQLMRRNPDATYMLVQSVIMQEQSLQEADGRIQELEAHVQELEDQLNPRRATAGGSGGFLGGRAGSVPSFGGGRMEQAASGANPWGSSPGAPRSGGAFSGGPTGGFGRGAPPAMAPQATPQPPPAQASSGGGFLRSALTTAAGVAGGMMVANSLGGLFGGGNSAQAASGSHGSTGSGQGPSVGNEDYGPSTAEGNYTDDGNDPGGGYDLASDDDNDPGSGFSSDDIEI